jgi:hypothetical protein
MLSLSIKNDFNRHDVENEDDTLYVEAMSPRVNKHFNSAG